MKVLRVTFRGENRAAIFTPANPQRVMMVLSSSSNRLTFETTSGKQVMINLDQVLMTEISEQVDH